MKENEQILFDYSKLKGRIVEVCGTMEQFSEKIGVSATTISKKFNNKSEWGQIDIRNACKVLGIGSKEIPDFFYNEKIQVL